MQFSTIHITPDWRQFIIDELPTLLIAVALLVIGGMDIPFASIVFCLALVLVFVAYYKYVYLRNMGYTITTEQIIYEHGVFTRSRDYIELYRIVDYDERRSFMQMLFGLKTIVVHSGDRTMPKLSIVGVKDRSNIVDTLRERVRYNRQRMNIHEFANYI